MGKVLDIKKHPDADTLYIETVDLGESTGPRTVVSGLVKYYQESEIAGKLVVCLKNMKPANMRGVKSMSMLLCASNADHTAVELLVPPPGSAVGDVVSFEGHPGEFPPFFLWLVCLRLWGLLISKVDPSHVLHAHRTLMSFLS